jgi:hypothetical protein
MDLYDAVFTEKTFELEDNLKEEFFQRNVVDKE